MRALAMVETFDTRLTVDGDGGIQELHDCIAPFGVRYYPLSLSRGVVTHVVATGDGSTVVAFQLLGGDGDIIASNDDASGDARITIRSRRDRELVLAVQNLGDAHNYFDLYVE